MPGTAEWNRGFYPSQSFRRFGAAGLDQDPLMTIPLGVVRLGLMWPDWEWVDWMWSDGQH
jgi:hypothetical protein